MKQWTNHEWHLSNTTHPLTRPSIHPATQPPACTSLHCRSTSYALQLRNLPTKYWTCWEHVKKMFANLLETSANVFYEIIAWNVPGAHVSESKSSPNSSKMRSTPVQHPCKNWGVGIWWRWVIAVNRIGTQFRLDSIRYLKIRYKKKHGTTNLNCCGRWRLNTPNMEKIISPQSHEQNCIFQH